MCIQDSTQLVACLPQFIWNQITVDALAIQLAIFAGSPQWE